MVTMFGFWDPKRGKLQRLGAQFVEEKDGKVARRQLEQLSRTFLLPQLQSTLQRQSDDNPQTNEIAQALLYQQLSALREKSLPLPDLTTLTEWVALEAVVQQRAEQPGFRRLLHQVLYLLRNRADCFSLEKSSTGALLAGIQGARQTAMSARWQRWVTAPGSVGAPLLQGLDLTEPESLLVLLERLLRDINHLVPVQALVLVVAALYPEPPLAAAEDERESTGAALSEKLETLYLLRQAWEALQLLPVRQRVVLLLGAESRTGESLLPFLMEQGIATEAELAQVMEIGARSFPLLLRELPCDDTRLAELLKLTPEAVRPLRQSARLKLAGHLSLWGGEGL
jgi:hypothetical protein